MQSQGRMVAEVLQNCGHFEQLTYAKAQLLCHLQHICRNPDQVGGAAALRPLKCHTSIDSRARAIEQMQVMLSHDTQQPSAT